MFGRQAKKKKTVRIILGGKWVEGTCSETDGWDLAAEKKA